MLAARFLGSKCDLCSDFYEYPIHRSAACPGICSKTHRGGGGVALQGRGCAWCWLGPLLPLPLQSKMTPFSLEEQSLKC